jgi:acetoin utilization deacetylase AcuC-like enzyme
MKKTGFLYDKRYLLHDTGNFHPERPARLNAVLKGITDGGLLSELTLLEGSRAEMKWIETVHDKNYTQRLKDACIAGERMFDSPDNQMCSETFETALLAVGGVIDAAKMIMTGKIDNAFCAVRPPGHHAEKAKAMGFCYFNNVAIAARYFQIEWGIEKVGIIDFDVHHGNGTQHFFEDDPTVFYYSIHEHPSFAYPGTGREFELGIGKGYGFTKNSPMLPGQGDDDYRKMIEKDLLTAFEAFRPEIIIASTGFDAHIDDDLADMKLSTKGFSWIMEQIVELAETDAEGRLLSVLEGGYALHRLPELAKNHVDILLRDP